MTYHCIFLQRIHLIRQMFSRTSYQHVNRCRISLPRCLITMPSMCLPSSFNTSSKRNLLYVFIIFTNSYTNCNYFCAKLNYFVQSSFIYSIFKNYFLILWFIVAQLFLHYGYENLPRSAVQFREKTFCTSENCLEINI